MLDAVTLDAFTPDAYEPDGPCGPEDLYFSPGGDEHDPAPIAGRLVGGLDTFTHLRDGDAAILFLMRRTEKVKGGRRILGEMCLPRFSGTLGPVGTWMLARLCDGVPDYVMVLDATWWVQASPIQREALVFHELEHAVQKTDKEGEFMFTPEGRPVWDIRGHSLEEFDSVVRRYGAWSPDIQGFIGALREGGAL